VIAGRESRPTGDGAASPDEPHTGPGRRRPRRAPEVQTALARNVQRHPGMNDRSELPAPWLLAMAALGGLLATLVWGAAAVPLP
jgi:hypothetical protein